MGTVASSNTSFTSCNDYSGTTANTSSTCDAGTFESLITNESGSTNTVISQTVQQVVEQITIDITNLSANSLCFCPGSSVTLTIGDSTSPTGVDMIKWFKGTTLLVTQTSPTKPYTYVTNSAGTYNALYKIGTTWYQTNAITIISTTTPTATISGSTTICQGNSATLSIALTGQSPWSFTYTDGSNPVRVTNYSGASPYTVQVSPMTTKTYTVSAINNNCCVGTTSGTATVTVNTSNVVINSQSTAAQTQCLGTSFNSISVTAAAITGSITGYQWYKNTTSSTIGGTSLGSSNGAQTNTYTPQSTSAGTTYYYCIVTGSCGSATSAISGAFVVKNLVQTNKITLQ